jgi:hypothetical protein
MSDNYGFIHSFHYNLSLQYASMPMLKDDLFKLNEEQIKIIHKTDWIGRKNFYNMKTGFRVLCYSVDDVKSLFKLK